MAQQVQSEIRYLTPPSVDVKKKKYCMNGRLSALPESPWTGIARRRITSGRV